MKSVIKNQINELLICRRQLNISNLENADFKKGISKPWDNCLFVTITKQLKLMCDKAD